MTEICLDCITHFLEVWLCVKIATQSFQCHDSSLFKLLTLGSNSKSVMLKMAAFMPNQIIRTKMKQ